MIQIFWPVASRYADKMRLPSASASIPLFVLFGQSAPVAGLVAGKEFGGRLTSLAKCFQRAGCGHDLAE
jgi:hypothetical protein